MESNDLISMIMIFIISSCLIFSGCISENDSFEKEQNGIMESKGVDQASMLPDWQDGKYHDYYETMDTLQELQIVYPDLVNIFSIGKSVLGRDIWCIRLTNEENDQAKFSCVIDGCIHGNEWESTEICLYVAEYLLINFETNRTMKSILNSSEIYFIPMLNPDGRQKDMRWNENGIDLNRNFDVHFGRIRGGSFRLGKLFGLIKIPMIELPRKGIYTNAGRRPFSEPETKALKNFFESIDTSKLAFYVNCHTAVHMVGSVCDISYKPEFSLRKNQEEVIIAALDWIEENTEYPTFYPEEYSTVGAGVAHHWVFKEYTVFSIVYELLSRDYEPGYRNGGPHDKLVHWMKASLPVLMYLFVNMEHFHDWSIPDVHPVLPDGIPPESI